MYLKYLNNIVVLRFFSPILIAKNRVFEDSLLLQENVRRCFFLYLSPKCPPAQQTGFTHHKGLKGLQKDLYKCPMNCKYWEKKCLMCCACHTDETGTALQATALCHISLMSTVTDKSPGGRPGSKCLQPRCECIDPVHRSGEGTRLPPIGARCELC